MKRALIATVCAFTVLAPSAHAQRGGFGGAFAGSIVGSALGSVIGNSIAPRAPEYVAPPIYVAPPVVVERRVYIAPAYVPSQRISTHPWIGPGFACYDPESSSVTRAICGSQDLSAQSLALVQAVYAAIQQTPYNASALHNEYAAFMQSQRAACAPYSYQQQADCISNMTSHERDVLTGRVSGLYADEAMRPVEVHVALQERLHFIGLLPGAVDGVYGDGTRRAIASWQAGQGRPATGVISNDEVALLMPGYQAPTMPAAYAPPPPPPVTPLLTAPAVAHPSAPADTPPVINAAAPANSEQTQTPDLLGGVHENMPYALARPKLLAAGWQTSLAAHADAASDQDRDARQWFIDHHVTEVQDCSSSGCKVQLHNMDGRLLYVYTQSGSHASDAYRGAGPAVIAVCLDVDDITCPTPSVPVRGAHEQAAR